MEDHQNEHKYEGMELEYQERISLPLALKMFSRIAKPA